MFTWTEIALEPQWLRKLTRQLDHGHVDFHEIRGDNTIRLLEEKQFQHRIPHVVLEVAVNTWYGRHG